MPWLETNPNGPTLQFLEDVRLGRLSASDTSGLVRWKCQPNWSKIRCLHQTSLWHRSPTSSVQARRAGYADSSACEEFERAAFGAAVSCDRHAGASRLTLLRCVRNRLAAMPSGLHRATAQLV